MTIRVFEWEEIKSIFAKCSPEEQELTRRVNDKLIAAVRSGSKTPFLDALEGESLELRDALVVVGWGNIVKEIALKEAAPSNRPERQAYREFFRSLDEEGQEAQLRGLMAWLAWTMSQRGNDVATGKQANTGQPATPQIGGEA
jgi:hypothetical protein